jgi:hypothetical protein
MWRIASTLAPSCHTSQSSQPLGGLVMRVPAARDQASCLEPVGLPSFAQHGQAGCASGDHEGRPFPWPGIAALMSVAGSRPTGPLDELARCSRTALRSTALRSASCAAHVPDRRPGHPPCPQPGRLNAKSVRTGSTAAPVAAVRQLGGTAAAGTPTLVTVGGPLAAAVAPAQLSRRPRLLGPSGDAVAALCAG